MGNQVPGRKNGVSKTAEARFDPDEIHVIKETWKELADRTNGKGIDKETFLQYFPLNGLLGDRLFSQFDVKKTGYIGFDAFINGLATMCRGSLEEKVQFIFNMYDMGNDNFITKQELTTLLNQNEETSSNGDLFVEDFESYTNSDLVERAFQECDVNQEGRLTYQEFKMWITKNQCIMDYIESIFPYGGPKDIQPHKNRKETLPHMKRIVSKARVSRSTSISDVAGDIFNHSTTNNRRISTKDRRMSQLEPHNGLISKENSFQNHVMSPAGGVRSSGRGHLQIGDKWDQNEEAVREHLIQAFEKTGNDTLKAALGELLDAMPGGSIQIERIHSQVYRTVVSLEDYLWKKGKTFHLITKKYFLLSGNCLYYYNGQNDVRPKGIIFITGSIIERVKDDDMGVKGYFGFEILHQDMNASEHYRHEKRIFYCRSEESREKWVVALQHAAHVVPIEDDYVIGKELGRGRFSVVCECVNKITGEHCAVKIIDKTTIEKDEKELLRTEIAVLKLVDHPNIIRMEGLYESKNYIYIVMEILKGGELFERIVGRPRFTEPEAARLIRPLLESVAYLHDLGIVHRDLKPENILCGENLDDLKIADFGLSKMVMPKEKMDAACGTLSYVAPEVLTMQGYGKEADLWSVGVIMFLLLCGKLPFDGDDHNEIIRSTIQADLKVNPNVWNKLSEDAKSLLTSLLNKNPKDRITAREALKHPFITTYHPNKKPSNIQTRQADSSNSLDSIGVADLSESPRPLTSEVVPIRNSIQESHEADTASVKSDTPTMDS